MMTKTYNFAPFFLFAAFFLCAGTLYGETVPRLYSSVPESQTGIGSEFEVPIFVKSNEPINAFDFSVLYSPDILELTDIRTALSLIDVWVSYPSLVGATGKVHVEGGSVETFQGEEGFLIGLTFKAKADGVANVSFGSPTVFLADGKGTRVIPQTEVYFLTVSENAPIFGRKKTEDVHGPVFEAIKIIQNPVGGQKLVTFSLHDEETGIQALYARIKTFSSWSEWFSIANPLHLSPGVWALEIKAVDTHGNSTLNTLYVWGNFFKTFLFSFYTLVFVGGIILFVVGIKKFKKRVSK